MRTKLIGTRLRRVEDPRLITGAGQFVDDVRVPGLCQAVFLRSFHAHARIKGIDTSKALAAPGVLTVITGADVQGKVGPQPVAARLTPDMYVTTHHALALDKVYFTGHPVAVVVAETQYQARDAVDLIEVDYEPLDAVGDPASALAPESPVIHEDLGTNLAFTWDMEGGDVEAAFDDADTIVTQRIVNQRLLPVPMEGRGAVGQWSPGTQRLTLWTSTQIPHLARTLIADMLKLPENRLRVIAPDVGGGFGQKLQVHVEEALVGFLAMRLRRPVKWVETRRENANAAIHGRDQVGDVEIACRNDGTITGIKYTVLADIGAYHQLNTAAIPTLTGLVLTGCYRIPAMRMSMKGVFTNKMSTDAYRGAGRPEATFLIERMMDVVAGKLGIDPVEIRRRNFIPPSAFPFTTPQTTVYDSGDYEAPLAKALAMAGYDDLRKAQAEGRKNGRYLGIGVSTYVEICGMGPSKALPTGGWESATVRVDPSGSVTVFTGVSPHGQGQETTFTQMVADAFGIAPETVLVVHGDTDQVQYGIGTFGSRGTAVGGTALHLAMQQLTRKATAIAAFLLEATSDEVTFSDGAFYVTAAPERRVPFLAVAAAAYDPKNYPAGVEPGLVATSFFEPDNFTYPFGAHVCMAEVDPETGSVTLLRYVAVDDCGRIINPMLVEGQVIGGIAQAAGQVLMEEGVYDESGQLITGEFTDYAIPKSTTLPRIETDRTETPTPVNPLGVKGVGEAGTIGGTPAIANAVIDALAPFGVVHVDMPLKPEKLWRAITAGRQASAT